jgi:hypothetical protein
MKFTLAATLALALLSSAALAAPRSLEAREDVDYGNVPGVTVPKVSDFCEKTGETPTNGLQVKGGSCSSTVQGSIPATAKMVSTLIIEPEYGQKICVGEPFDVVLRMSNIETGHFANPITEYYALPQALNDEGLIKGHSHVTIQALTSRDTPPDAQVFAFFLGLNDPAKDGKLVAKVVAGLPAVGLYRICTLAGSEGHQPVIMPVAQRGAQDDCIRINVVEK